MATDVLGAPIKRVEDPRFITGKGRYLDDIKLTGDDPHGHPAEPVRPRQHPLDRHLRGQGDARRARGASSAPTSRTTRCRWPGRPAASAGIQNNVNTPRILATDDVKWTGEGVAAVIAETAEQAFDALEAIQVDWEPLPAVVDAEKAIAAGRAAAPRERAEQRRLRVDGRRQGRAPTPRSTAPRSSSSQRLVNQRLIPNPMEVRGDIGWYNPGTDEYTIWMSSQTPHIQRLLLAAFVMGVPEHKIRCISPDIGGAFGSKIFCYADMALVMFASKAHRRPAGQVGREPARELPGHDPRPRPHHLPRDRRQARRRDHRAPRQDASPTSAAGSRRSARASPRRSTAASCPAATRSRTSTARSPASTRTRRSSTPTAAPAGRRRPTSSSGRWTSSPTRSGMDRGGDPAQELHPARRLPVRQPVGPRDRGRRREDLHRLGQLRAGPQQGARRRSTTTTSTPRRPRPGSGASSSASACRPTSRSAASRRRSGSAPSARAGARRCGSRPTSGST